MSERANNHLKNLAEKALKIVPLSGILFVLSYWTAKQVVSPHHRMIKMGILGSVLLFMFRFDMIYSLYVFTLLFPFPSGISIGSTNSILMALIGLTWAIRAASTGQPIVQKTHYDWAIGLLLLAYVMSFYNCETAVQVQRGLNVVFKQVASVVFFYLMIRFVDDEKRLMRFTKVVCIMVCVVVSTGLIELFFPGAQIIPGWIGLAEVKGQSSLTFRMQGIRLGGAVGGHNILGDISWLGVFFLVFHTIRARNPLEKTVWALGSVGSLITLLATANRGALLSLLVGMVYALYRFRHRVSVGRLVAVGILAVVLLTVVQVALLEFTYATNVFDRLMGTKFEGLEPDTRQGIWEHTFNRSLETPLLGHGPWYDAGIGLTSQYWPHNAYLYYFYTIGLVGLSAFLWVSWLVMRRSLVYKRPGIWGTNLGDLTTLLHVLVCTLLFSQIRTDHQRDEIHIHVIWLVFGLAAAASSIAVTRIRESAKAGGSGSNYKGSAPSTLT